MLGVGGSGPTKRVSTEKFLEFMKLCSDKLRCKFFLAAGLNEIEEKIINQILNSKFKNKCMTLNKLKIPNEMMVISAHRTPDRLRDYCLNAEKRGIKTIIAGAGGAAALPGCIAAYTQIPVLGVPIESKSLKGMDSLLSIVQMPAGIPVGTLAIGKPGSINAALLAAAIIANEDKETHEKLKDFRKKQSNKVRLDPL